MFTNSIISSKVLLHQGREYRLNYIGLSDINGIPICEGDILEYTIGFAEEPESQEKMRGVVVYFPRSAAFGMLSIRGYLNGANPANEGVIGDLFAFSSTVTEYKVLGNVFGNNELLVVADEDSKTD